MHDNFFRFTYTLHVTSSQLWKDPKTLGHPTHLQFILARQGLKSPVVMIVAKDPLSLTKDPPRFKPVHV